MKTVRLLLVSIALLVSGGCSVWSPTEHTTHFNDGDVNVNFLFRFDQSCQCMRLFDEDGDPVVDESFSITATSETGSSFIVEINGGDPPYILNVEWVDENGVPRRANFNPYVSGQNINFDPAVPTIYTLQVIDSEGLSSNTTEVTLTD